MLYKIICPYCGEDHEPTYNDCDDIGFKVCRSCGEKFYVDVDYEPNYRASKSEDVM